MTLHFAYGSNMSRALMRIHAPGAAPLGAARLLHRRFFVMRCGYASVAPEPGSTVIGVLWRLTARDVASLNVYEGIASGLYRVERLSVLTATGREMALVYVGCNRAEGRPRPGYLEAVIEAAQEWDLPEPYIRSLRRWSPGRWSGARAPEMGELR